MKVLHLFLAFCAGLGNAILWLLGAFFRFFIFLFSSLVRGSKARSESRAKRQFSSRLPEWLGPYRSPRRFAYLIALLVVLVALPIAFLVSRQIRDVEAAWWNDHWGYRQRVSLSNPGTETINNAQVSFELDTAGLISAGKLQSNCADLRVVDQSGRQLQIWISQHTQTCNQANTQVWLNVMTLHPGANSTNVFVYYGNSSAHSVLNSSWTMDVGGELSFHDGDVIHTFLESGSYINVANRNAQLLVVGGGGSGGGRPNSSGGWHSGGGGGGGGIVYLEDYELDFGGEISVLVGQGGEPTPRNSAPSSDASRNGENSQFNDKVALGGGGGGDAAGGTSCLDGISGGSGGGAGTCAALKDGGSGQVGQGNDGGSNRDSPGFSGLNLAGGGGSGASGNIAGGAGGDGGYYSISGTSVAYGGGGGGGSGTTSAFAPGGAGGGGAGGGNADGEDAVSNTGGGGGGGSRNFHIGGSGGSGIVIVRYPHSGVTVPENITSTTHTEQSSPAPIAHWSFDEGAGPIAHDVSGRTGLGNTFVGSDETFAFDGYLVHAYTSTGNNEFRVPPGIENIDVLVVAGGGGGGRRHGAGGGAGGVLFQENYSVQPGQTVSLTVGDGGVGSTGAAGSGNGENSIFGSLTSIGGGGGGQFDTPRNGNNGGSGGGATSGGGSPGLGTPGQGNNGGNAGSNHNHGGGGGAGSPGVNGTYNSQGDGGEGIDLSQHFGQTHGENGWFAGGGGGGGHNPQATEKGHGGIGGGGDGGEPGINNPGLPGMPNTGGGGGGAATSSSGNSSGGNGGSGIVLVRYKATGAVGNHAQLGSSVVTDTHNPTWLNQEMCLSGKCLRFNGQDQFLEVRNNNAMRFSQGGSISVWVKPRSAGGGDEGRILDRATTNSQAAGGWALYTTSNNRVGFRVNEDSPTLTSANALTPNHWNHVFVTIESGARTIYVNGIDVTETAGSTTTPPNSSGVLRIGNRVGATDRGFDGDIDEIKLYDYARSTQEIMADYTSGFRTAGSSVSIGQQNRSSLSNGLIGYWKMDEASWNGTTGEVRDASGNENHGTAIGGANVTGGKFGNAGSFNGSSRYVQTNYTLNQSAGNPGATFAAWVRPAGTGGRRHVISTDNGGYDWSMLKQGNVWTVFTNTNSITTDFSVDLHQWQHVVAVFDPSQMHVRFYKNGEEVIIPHLGFANSTNNLSIGRNPGYPQFFNGLIDEARVYNRPLSHSEVLQLYSYTPGPIAHWKFDEGSGTTVYDSSGNENHGQMVNMNDSNWVLGANNQGSGLQFDGDTQYVLSTVNNSIKGLSEVSISAWIKRNASGIQIIYEEPINNSLGSSRFSLRLATNNTISLFGRDEDSGTGKTFVQSNVPVSQNEWNHIVAIFNANTNTHEIYINGVNRGTNSLVVESFDNTNPFAPARIGTYPGTSGLGLNGSIDQVKIYNYALTPDQILQDMRGSGAPIDPESTETPPEAVRTVQLGSNTERDQLADGPSGGPIAYWNFDEMSGTTANDSAGNNAGTLVGNPEWTQGKVGGGLRFDETNYVEVAHNSEMDISEDISISLWVNPTVNLGSSANPGLISKRSSWGGIWVNKSNGRIWGRLIQSNSQNINLPQNHVLQPNVWSHISLVANSQSGRVKQYVNGKLVGEAIYNGTINTSNDPLLIGNQLNEIFDGLIDEVKIYDYALSPAQVAYEYNRGAPVAHWQMDECEGNIIHDASGNNHHGTLVIGSSGSQANIGTCETPGTAWGNGKDGKINSAMSFDGVDDYVELPSSFNFIPAANAPITVSLWLKPDSITGGNYSRRAFTLSRGPGSSTLIIGFDQNNKAFFYDGSSRREFANNVNLNEWIHLVVRYDGTQSTVYQNGIIAGGPFTHTLSAGSADLAVIGSRPDRGANFYSGLIDDIRIYNYPLSEMQIKQLHNQGAAIRFN